MKSLTKRVTAAALLVLFTPVVALSTMTVSWGPVCTGYVNGVAGLDFSGPSTLKLDPDYITFGNGSNYARDMKSIIVFSPIGMGFGVTESKIVSENSSWTKNDGGEVASYSASNSSVAVYLKGQYQDPSRGWVTLCDNYETTFNYYSYP